MKKITVSIGIPVYNEENNIIYLINALRAQKEKHIVIKEILVYTDGSTDKTVDLVRSQKDPRIKLKIGNTRKGQQIRQNQILKDFSSEVIVLLEGDILPANRNTIENLVKPFTKGSKNLGMVIGMPVIIKPECLYEKILAHGYEMKFKIFAEWKNGKNVYSCGGHSMKALSRQFSEKLQWPTNVPEDAYTFLLLTKLGFDAYKEQGAKAYMRNVTNLNDRIKQIKKFRSGKMSLFKYFSEDFINKEYSIPKKLIIKYLTISFIKNPCMTIFYILELILNRLLTMDAKKFNALENPHHSSKVLVGIGRKVYQ